MVIDLFTRTDLVSLLEEREPPYVSLFSPTHRGGGEADPLVIRHLVDYAQERLAHEMRSVEARDFVAPLRALQNDDTFWATRR